jgi:hypothetical protein
MKGRSEILEETEKKGLGLIEDLQQIFWGGKHEEWLEWIGSWPG